jgi:signal transduction histidine kinase
MKNRANTLLNLTRSGLEPAHRSVQANLAQLYEEEARQRAIFAALREPILTTSADGRVMEFNAAASALFGGPGRLYGRPIQELLPFVAAPAERAGQATTWQGQISDATGRTLDLEVSRTTLADARLPGCDIYVVHDVSQYAELNRLREQLLYSVAHELRGPLAILDNVLEILISDYEQLSVSEFEQLMHSARRTSVRIHALMEDLLSAGSIQSGRFHVRVRPTLLSTVLDEAVDMLKTSSEARGQRVEREISGDQLCVLADGRYIRQVLFNLLNNASKYSPDGEVIRVRAERTEGNARVTVEDRGPGIPAEQRAGLFERFYRVRPGNTEPGVGLGLAIAKGIIDAHGGEIGLDGEAGNGTRLWFTLRLADEELRDENPPGR